MTPPYEPTVHDIWDFRPEYGSGAKMGSFLEVSRKVVSGKWQWHKKANMVVTMHQALVQQEDILAMNKWLRNQKR